jgi:hypothetical protein
LRKGTNGSIRVATLPIAAALSALVYLAARP